MQRPLYVLGERLAACAELVRNGKRVADIGTDHAYLPIWLIKSEKIPSAIAADLRQGPLQSARDNALKYDVSDKLSLKLSDGLEDINSSEVDDVVMAGLGGELILRIVRETEWLKNNGKRLILQPMTSVTKLREGLRDEGFTVVEEKIACENRKIYSAFAVEYTAENENKEELFSHMGIIRPEDHGAREYANYRIKKLNKEIKGLVKNKEAFDQMAKAISEIEKMFL